MAIDFDKAALNQKNNGSNQELKRPNRPAQKPDRQTPVSDASKGLTVAIRDTVSRHSFELSALRNSKQVLIDKIADAYVAEVENLDAEIAMEVATRLQEVQQSAFPLGLFLEDWKAPSDRLSGYQPKYLPSAGNG